MVLADTNFLLKITSVVKAGERLTQRRLISQKRVCLTLINPTVVINFNPNLIAHARFFGVNQMTIEELVYDWNTIEPSLKQPNRRISFDDETLRDGLQSPSVCEPPVEQKIELLHLMEALSIDTADIGLPGAGGTHAAGVERLAREIAEKKLKIRPNCAARTHRNDIVPIVEISQRAGIAIEACTFIGSSSVRFFAEDWTLDKLLKMTEEAVSFAVGEGVPVMYVTEDTTRAKPDVIRALYTTAIRNGAKAVCVCDTVGHSTPDGARAVVRFVKNIIEEEGGNIRLDWHGHQDRGLGVINSIAAIQGGADQVHGSALGIGERVGNTPLDQLLVNLKLMGWIKNDLSRLGEYCKTAARICDWSVPYNYPVFGRDAFRTATGVHAAAVIKSYKKGDQRLADIVYSGVPAGEFGLEQVIDIGPMSGKSNVVFWLEKRGITPEDERVNRIFEYAKSSHGVLEESEIRKLLEQ
jgi:isopropylmalate/homocitrate/citramalate synthase